MGLSKEYFWDLTWYEWGLEVLRLNDIIQQKIDDMEHFLLVHGMQIADFRNVNFRNENDQPLKLTFSDIFPNLSFSKELQTKERKLTFKEQKQILGSRFKRDGNK
jgi:hypothetical protein